MIEKEAIKQSNQRKGNFIILVEPNGPFSIDWEKGPIQAWKSFSFTEQQELKTERKQICEIFEVSSLAEIPQTFKDPKKRDEARIRANRYFADLFGVRGNKDGIKAAQKDLQREKETYDNNENPEIVERKRKTAEETLRRAEEENIERLNDNVRSLSSLANGTIKLVEQQVLGPRYSSLFEVSNEVQTIDQPADLIALMVDPRYDSRIRFEAKRKLVLMKVGGAVKQTEREMQTREKFQSFLTFMEGLWEDAEPEDLDGKDKIGQAFNLNLYTRHNPDNFECIDVKVISPEELKAIQFTTLPLGEKLTIRQARKFKIGNKNVPVYITLREKQASARILKLLRKGHTNPAAAVEDEMGLMGIVANKKDITLFMQHLQNMAKTAGKAISIEEPEDTIDNGSSFSAKNDGSSDKLETYKFFVRMDGMRVEFILHTFRTYANYLYRDEVSYEEFQKKRFFDSGTAKLLYPESIYNYNQEQLKNTLTTETRKHVREH